LSELEITGLYKYTQRDFEGAIEAITSGRIRVEPLISACYPLSDIEEAYQAVLNEPDRMIKVMLAPHEGVDAGRARRVYT
jgi:threonine dehydrogenase-like Zn-dependent dehydrogenase